MSKQTTKFSHDQPPQTVNAEACRFKYDAPVKFMAAEDGDDVLHPISMMARTDKPLTHWFWGRIVHDMSGIKPHKETIVADYCHDDDQIIGYLNEFGFEGGLHVKGAIVKQDGNKSKEVAFNGTHGVPYESSIFFDPDFGLVIEQVGEGASVEVNGYTFEGPGVVVRECVLRAVAICPHGYDGGTTTEFSNENQPVSITYRNSKTMADDQPKTEEAGKDVAELSTKVAGLESAIGKIQGMLSKALGVDDVPEDLPTALSQIEELKTKLAAAESATGDRGESGSGEGGGEGSDNATELSARLEKLEAESQQLKAKLKHAEGSDNEGVTGDTTGSEGNKSKAKFADLFKMRGAVPAKADD